MSTVGSLTAGQLPPPPALVSLRADVASYVMAANNDRALAKASDFITDALDEMNTRVWGWNYVSQDITFLTTTRDYALANQFKAARDAQTVDPNGNSIGRLEYRDPTEFVRLAPNATLTIYPKLYTVRNSMEYGLLTLDSTPTSGLILVTPTLRLWYFRRVQYDPLNMPSEAAGYVRWRAKASMAAHFDLQKVGYAEKRAEALWNRIVADDREHHFQAVPLGYYP